MLRMKLEGWNWEGRSSANMRSMQGYIQMGGGGGQTVFSQPLFAGPSHMMDN